MSQVNGLRMHFMLSLMGSSVMPKLSIIAISYNTKLKIETTEIVHLQTV